MMDRLARSVVPSEKRNAVSEARLAWSFREDSSCITTAKGRRGRVKCKIVSLHRKHYECECFDMHVMMHYFSV